MHWFYNLPVNIYHSFLKFHFIWDLLYRISHNTATGLIDLLHKSHNASVPYPTIYHFVTEMCTSLHISVTKHCLVLHQSGIKPNLIAKIWLPTLVTICNGLPKLVDKISSHIDRLVNTGLDVGSLVKWLPIEVATPANQTQFEWFIARRL